MRDADSRPPVVLLPDLTYDRRHFAPLQRELAGLDPGRRVLAWDLPGHRDQPHRDSYRIAEVASVIHDDVIVAGIDGPRRDRRAFDFRIIARAAAEIARVLIGR
jgi:pimeloyl-ACP methyl ester carboxylesterase